MNDECAITATLKLFSAKWKPCLLSHLMVGERRYSELMKLIPTISKKMLTEHLRELERDGLIYRVVYPSVPPKVTYFLTGKGRSLENIFNNISDWGVSQLENVLAMEDLVPAS